MSDFDRDIPYARDAFQDWGWEDGHFLSRDDASKVRDLLNDFGEKRAACFEAMAGLLELREEKLAERWQRICDVSLELLNKLDSDIGDTAKNSDESYSSMSAIGLKDFAEGEKKIWQECRRATLHSSRSCGKI